YLHPFPASLRLQVPGSEQPVPLPQGPSLPTAPDIFSSSFSSSLLPFRFLFHRPPRDMVSRFVIILQSFHLVFLYSCTICITPAKTELCFQASLFRCQPVKPDRFIYVFFHLLPTEVEIRQPAQSIGMTCCRSCTVKLFCLYHVTFQMFRTDPPLTDQSQIKTCAYVTCCRSFFIIRKCPEL